MDSIGIDENHCPVIFEYKRSVNENVINQGLFYLNWLLDHKDSFKILVIEKWGMEAADKIDWTMPRVICTQMRKLVFPEMLLILVIGAVVRWNCS